MRRVLIGLLMVLPVMSLLAQEEQPLFEATFEEKGFPLPIGTEIDISGRWDTDIKEEAGNHFLYINGIDENAAFFLSNGLGWTNYSIAADLRFQSGAIFLDTRTSDTQCSGYRFIIGPAQNYIGLVTITSQGGRCVSGTVLQEYKSFFPDWSRWFNVRVQVNNDNIRVYVNNDLMLSRQDNSFTTGSARFSMALGTVVDIDNIRVMGLAADTVAMPPRRLDNYAQAPEIALAELQAWEMVPLGGRMLFQGKEAYEDGPGAWYITLDQARGRQYSDIVMAGDFTFTPASVHTFFSDNQAELEFCGFIVRIEPCNCGDDGLGYLEAGMTNQGTVMASQQLPGKAEFNLLIHDVRPFDVSQAHHLMLVVVDEHLSLFMDGTYVFNKLEVVDRKGFIGFAMTGANTQATCQADNLWAYTFDQQ